MGAELLVDSPSAPVARNQSGGLARLLLAVLLLQLLAQLPPFIDAIAGMLRGTAAFDGPLPPVPNAGWIPVALSASLLILMALAEVGLIQGLWKRPSGWIALGTAVAAQAFLLGGTITLVAQNVQAGSDIQSNGMAATPGLMQLNALLGVLVFLLTWVAYATARSQPTDLVAAPGVPGRGRDRSRLWRAALGGAAMLVVVTGNVASASKATLAIACADVAADVGISFRGGTGNAVLDGSDMSVAMQLNMGNGVAVGDYDRDGDPDLYLLGQPGHPNRLFRNDHTSTSEGFTDVTDATGLGGLSGSRAAQFVDLDNDGRLDLVVADDYVPGTALQPSRIYRDRGDGTFEDVTGQSGFAPVGVIVGGLGIADYNRDGLPDIYVTYWAGGMELGAAYDSHNILYENLGGLRFKDVTGEVGLGARSTGSYTPIFADLNADGWPDLYIATDGAPDALFINDGGRFRDATSESGLGGIRNGMGAALLDVEGSGVPSIYVTNITEPDHLIGTVPGGNVWLRSRLRPGGLAYVDEAAEAGIRETGWGWGATFADLDLDGNPDLFVAQGMDVATRNVSAALTNDRAHVFAGTDNGTFDPSIDNGCDIPGDQRAVVAFDYNRDGLPDLFVTQIGYDYALLENRSPRAGHWLTVGVKPTVGRTIVGTRVTVTAGGQRRVQQLIGGGSYLAGPPNEASFGLGSVDGPVTVSVDWPDGTTTTKSDVAVDQILVVGRK